MRNRGNTMTLQQIHKAKKAFYKADYNGKRAIVQREIDEISECQELINYYCK